MYNILMSLYAFGVWVASHFSEKIKKMWNGEHESFRILLLRAMKCARIMQALISVAICLSIHFAMLVAF